MTISVCPINHSQDSEAIDQYYRIVKIFPLPWCHNIFLQTVHRCHLTEIGLNAMEGVGDGRNAAVITYDERKIGPMYINSNVQAEAICDVITCLLRGEEISLVSKRLLGSDIVNYLRNNLPK